MAARRAEPWRGRCVRLAFAALTLAAAGSARGQEFHNLSQGVVGTGSFGTSMSGDTIMGELGASSDGIRSLRQGAWLLQWSGLVAARGGWLGNEHPFLLLLGEHGHASGELDHRFDGATAWRPYLGLGLNADELVMTSPGVRFSALDTFNDMGGVGGTSWGGALRVTGGGSFLSSSRSLLLAGFAQEALVGPEIDHPGSSFSEGGVFGRYDVSQRLCVLLEGLAGLSPVRATPALGLTDQTTHAEIASSVRYVFGNGMWVSGALRLARNFDRLRYASGGTYHTADAPVTGVALQVGVPIGRQR